MPDVDLFAEEGTTAVILTKKEKAEVKKIEGIITILRRQHGNGEDCVHPVGGHVVPDSEFDAYVKRLTELDPDSKILLGAMSASDFDPNAGKVVHDPPMTSIKKANGSLSDKQKELEKFIQTYADEFGISADQAKKKIVVSFKRDGVACSIVYKKGKLVEAGLRPRDGITGENVTENIKHVKGVPLTLPEPLDIVVRGELECKISVFDKIVAEGRITRSGGEPFANPRNYTAGSIRQFKDPSVTKDRRLSFTAYSILGHENASYKTERERAIWCNKELGIPFVRTEFLTDDILEELEGLIPTVDYEVDGAVISINDLEEQSQMGVHGSAANAVPKGKLAWKFSDETADPFIEKIEWNTGRTGHVVPLCTFKGVRLAGTTVSNAAGHNLGFVVRNDISKGKQVRIRKSGKIIPHVLGRVNKGKFIPTRDAGDATLPVDLGIDKYDYPKQCPSCKEATEVVEGKDHGLLELRCENNSCPSRNIKTFLHYLEKFGVLGVGEATVTRWVESGLVTKFADFYTLSVKDLIASGESPRQSLLAIASIHMINKPEQEKDNQKLAAATVAAMRKKKPITLAKFFSCLGISGSGRSAGTALANHFADLKLIANADADELVKIEGMGGMAAKKIPEYFDKYRDDILDLAKEHLEIILPKQGRYTGMAFVFTGGLPEGKDYWKDAVESEGGVVKSSVSKKIDYVVAGVDCGSKLEKAKEIKRQGFPINIIELKDLKAMLK